MRILVDPLLCLQAVLEATWPSDMTNSSQLMWNKLRNVIVGAALFKKAGKKSARRRLSSNVDFLTADKTECMEHALSRSSLDSSHSQDTEAAHSDCKLISLCTAAKLHQFSNNDISFLFSQLLKAVLCQIYQDSDRSN